MKIRVNKLATKQAAGDAQAKREADAEAFDRASRKEAVRILFDPKNLTGTKTRQIKPQKQRKAMELISPLFL